MKRLQLISFLLVLLPVSISLNQINGQSISSDNIINKDKGRIILAYKSFEEFLKSDKSWESYRKIVLGSCPEMQAVHNKTLSWGSIDSVRFPEEVTKIKNADWEQYFREYDRKTLDYLYDSLIARANKTLAPLNHNHVDLCLFLPYGGCFIIPGERKCTIYISLLINPDEVPKIMIHEYAHNLHIQRRPVEPFNLKRELVSEGMAVYLTTLILKDPGLSKSVPFMPDSSVQWCFKNEHLIKNTIKTELGDTTFNCLKKFIADGPVSTPPKGFVEKTGYFAGYRIIEACIKKGMKLEDICSLNSDSVIAGSGYFN
jgi:Predicted Zn-dependent protease (DUF2268).